MVTNLTLVGNRGFRGSFLIPEWVLLAPWHYHLTKTVEGDLCCSCFASSLLVSLSYRHRHRSCHHHFCLSVAVAALVGRRRRVHLPWRGDHLFDMAHAHKLDPRGTKEGEQRPPSERRMWRNGWKRIVVGIMKCAHEQKALSKFPLNDPRGVHIRITVADTSVGSDTDAFPGMWPFDLDGGEAAEFPSTNTACATCRCVIVGVCVKWNWKTDGLFLTAS